MKSLDIFPLEFRLQGLKMAHGTLASILSMFQHHGYLLINFINLRDYQI